MSNVKVDLQQNRAARILTVANPRLAAGTRYRIQNVSPYRNDVFISEVAASENSVAADARYGVRNYSDFVYKAIMTTPVANKAAVDAEGKFTFTDIDDMTEWPATITVDMYAEKDDAIVAGIDEIVEGWIFAICAEKSFNEPDDEPGSYWADYLVQSAPTYVAATKILTFTGITKIEQSVMLAGSINAPGIFWGLGDVADHPIIMGVDPGRPPSDRLRSGAALLRYADKDYWQMPNDRGLYAICPEGPGLLAINEVV